MSSRNTTAPTISERGETRTTAASDGDLSTRRLNVMRFGYAFMGVGLAIVKWPLLFHAHPCP